MIEDARRSVTTLLLGGAGSLVLVALYRHRWRNGLRLAARPPFRTVVPWHGAVGFARTLNGAGVVDVLVQLEQVGGFTLLGYAMAEWRGRRELSLGSDLPLVVGCAALFAGSLELAQGWLSGPGASLLRGVLATAGTAYGVAVYHLARSHVRALRASDATAAATEAA